MITEDRLEQSLKFLAESDEEREQFREEWDQQLHPVCANYLGATLSDVGGKIDHQKHVALIQYLYLRSLAGKKLTKSDWLT